MFGQGEGGELCVQVAMSSELQEVPCRDAWVNSSVEDFKFNRRRSSVFNTRTHSLPLVTKGRKQIHTLYQPKVFSVPTHTSFNPNPSQNDVSLFSPTVPRSLKDYPKHPWVKKLYATASRRISSSWWRPVDHLILFHQGDKIKEWLWSAWRILSLNCLKYTALSQRGGD